MSNDEDFRALQRQMQATMEKMNKLAGETPEVLFKEFALSYMNSKLARPKLRASTKTSFSNQILKHLIPRFGMLPLGKITNAIWLQWIEDEKALSKFFNARKALVEVLRAANKAGHLDKIPELDNPDEYEAVGRVLEDTEVMSILWKAPRPFRFIFYVFWRMGCRPRELLQWEWAMLKFNEPAKTYVTVPTRISKTGRTRSIPIDPCVSRILARRHRIGNSSDFVFPARQDNRRPQLSYQSAFVTACRKAKVAKAMVYDFRRTRITKWAAAGKSLAFVARMLDTSEPMIRRVYLKDDHEVMEGLFND